MKVSELLHSIAIISITQCILGGYNMHLSGQTPLLRAKNLEKHFGMDSIYLKLEGSNPTGHKNDRIAESLIQFASDQGYEGILLYGTTQYMQSVLYFANAKQMKIFAPKSKETLAQQKRYPQVNWVTIGVINKKEPQDAYEIYAKEEKLFFVCEWEKKPFIRNLAMQGITEEILAKVEEPTYIWTQLNGGYTLRSVYHELMRSWVKGKFTKLPEIHCGVNQAVLDEVPIRPELEEIVQTTKATLHLMDSDELKETVRMIKKIENLNISPKEAFSLAAMLKEAKGKKGTHIVILNDGKTDIQIKEISKDPNLNKEEIVSLTMSLLEPYNDSLEETIDAINQATENGFIFMAKHKEEIHGICVVVDTGFPNFIPSYHLAYIGVKKSNKGRGVATELINQAIEKTDGNLSLHVDIPNKGAKKLYEKMGFYHKYERMVYKV